MERLESSTRWGRTFINKQLADAVSSIREHLTKDELADLAKGKPGPKINHTVYPDGKVKRYNND